MAATGLGGDDTASTSFVIGKFKNVQEANNLDKCISISIINFFKVYIYKIG